MVQTPKRPVLIALGDSVTAGHHKDTAEGGTSCRDAGYSYASSVAAGLNASLPAVWSLDYVNWAQSGYSTRQVLGLDSNADACGLTHPGAAPIARVEAELASRPGSWNRVVVTAGVNDTNWSATLVAMIPDSQVPGAGGSFCYTDLELLWNFDEKEEQILSGVDEIASRLEAADPTAKIVWNGYFNMAGSGPLNARCHDAVQTGLNTLQSAISTGLAGHSATLVSNSSLTAAHIQDWFWTDAPANLVQGIPPGWPHPNQAGATRIASNDLPALR